MDADGGGFDLNGLAGAGELMRGNTVDLLGGEGRRGLLHLAAEAGCELTEFLECMSKRTRVGAGGAFSVVGVGGKAEVDAALVGLFGSGEVLGKARVVAEQQWQNTGSHGVECAEVADGALRGGAADDVDDVVGGDAGGLVQNEKSIHARTSLLVPRKPTSAIVSLGAWGV